LKFEVKRIPYSKKKETNSQNLLMMSIDKAQLPLLPSARKKRLLKEETLEEPRKDIRTEEEGDASSQTPNAFQRLPQHLDANEEVNTGAELEREAAIARRKENEQERISQLKTFSSLPPLPATTTTSNLMHYLSTTTRFINTFAASTNESCIRSSNAIDNLEIKMSLLESKINSMTIVTHHQAQDGIGGGETKS
jgi:hypothetical protein